MTLLKANPYNSSCHSYRNRCIRDALDLYDMDLHAFSSLIGMDEEKCRRMLDEKELTVMVKMSWIARILKHAFGDLAPHFLSLKEMEDFLRQIREARGPAWMEEPSVIEGSSRHYHQEVYKTIFADQGSAGGGLR